MQDSRAGGGAPLVSVITPTFQRQQFLPLAYRCFSAQTLKEAEWLVLDDSPQPSVFMLGLNDPRVNYVFNPQRLSIGTKRNLLIARARGEVIAQFDDDDHYAPHYLETMLRVMRERQADFVKFFGYFLYSQLYDAFGYWDLTRKVGPHLVWSAQPMQAAWLDPSNNSGIAEVETGYGFSYVFRKAVWESAPFPDMNWSEDAVFYKEAARRFLVVGIDDEAHSCLHILHRSNTSRCFPQHWLPRFMLPQLFPESGAWL